MPFSLISALFYKNNALNIDHMAMRIFLKCLDLRKNVYSRTTSYAVGSVVFFAQSISANASIRVCNDAGE